VSRPIATLRRSWLLICIGAVVGLVVGLASTLGNETLYSAQAQVFFSNINYQASITGTPNATAYANAATVAATESQLARTSAVVRPTLAATDSSSSVSGFLARAKVAPVVSAPNILSFKVEDASPHRAQRLANRWARVATSYRQRLDTAAIREAIAQIDARLGQLEKSGAGGTSSDLYRSLIDHKQQLETMKTLQSANGTVVQQAMSASAIGRSTLRTTGLAVIAGALIGMALAFLWELFFPRAEALEAATVLPADEPSRKRKELVG
jgi:uncharacterized protein involved in exopolysaccharide biosynthesis